MNWKRWIGLLCGASLACLCATCAPVDDSAAGDKKGQSGPAVTDAQEPAPIDLPPAQLVASSQLQQRIELAIKNIRERDVLTSNSFWVIFHNIVGLGPTTTLLSTETGTRVNALDYICNGGAVRGMKFWPTAHGLEVQTGPTFVGQGHQDQFIAELAQWGMPADRKFLVDGTEYHYMDFVRNAQARSRITGATERQELSWTVLVVGQYVDTEASWKNQYGEQLRMEDLLRYELNEPMDKAACGGTHRLFDLCWVHYLHLKHGGKTTGIWKDVADNTVKYEQLARQYQNPDGSFSTSFFNGPGEERDKQLQINTTGHIFEFLSLALTDAELRQPWVESAANALAMMILDIQGAPMESGTLYHAAHGLIIYHARVFDPSQLGKNGLVFPLPPEARTAAAGQIIDKLPTPAPR
ncbi:MAG TPA: hypothetical protein VK395_21810 [Gemmataceae bacterium]|nr:hypothetical protein [Gemmataceae bacterium]